MPAEARPVNIILLDDTVTAPEVSRTMARFGWLTWLDDPPGHLGDRLLAWSQSLSIVEDPTQPYDGPLVYLREQHTTGTRMLIITGDSDGAVTDALASQMPHENEADLLTAAARADDPLTLVRALHRLAILATPAAAWFAWRDADPRYLVAWRRLLAHPHPVVRRVAINQSDLLPWHEIDDLLREREPIELELADTVAEVMEDRLRHMASA